MEAARARGLPVEGPFAADTVFLRVQGGLPVPILTPAHGTAFDIAGQGKANPGAMLAAFQLACRMAASHREHSRE